MAVQISESAVLYSLAGGALIGLSATVLFLSNGRIAGVSGILSRALLWSKRDRAWRVAFLGGMLSGGFLLRQYNPEFFNFASGTSSLRLALAGLLVGFGSSLGGGCTSGHGVCGISRLSKRSLLATLIFMLTGFVTVLLLKGFVG
jgi:uncharacterized protein